MKRIFNNPNSRNLSDMYTLSSEEMLKVRGGGGDDDGTKPPSREKDIFDLDGE
ncbi:MAG: hypothetical protein WCY58_07595 [Mariniphaga sp.]|nr:hypothetical protein [Mariniphaga sp.]